MLPSQGRCIAVFLLARVARLKVRHNVEEWVESARSASSFMAASVNLQQPAQALISYGLVSVRQGIQLGPALVPFTSSADRVTLFGIARLLLLASPPLWLNLAVDIQVKREYIPSWDLQELSWLDPDLDALLLEVRMSLGDSKQDDLRKELGSAAELLIMSALSAAGIDALHVAKISDAFGYDIECHSPSIDRIEIKAASENTRGKFHLTRNEFDKSFEYPNQWRLVQVVFMNRAFVQRRLDASNVLGVFQLRTGALSRAIPPDTPAFRWTGSAEVHPSSDEWFQASIKLECVASGEIVR